MRIVPMPAYDVQRKTQHQEDTMTPTPPRRLFGIQPLIALALLCLAGSSAWAQPAQSGKVMGGAPANTAEPRPPASVRFIKAPSDETPAARTRRLKRECKGKPNAGMCLGHAS